MTFSKNSNGASTKEGINQTFYFEIFVLAYYKFISKCLLGR